MTKKTKKSILLGILAVVLAGAVVGYYQWNKPHRSVKSADGTKVTAEALITSYIRDTAAAAKTYTDKVVEVSGEVADTSSNQQNERVIKLKTQQEGAFINCTFEQKDAQANPGEKISVKGICSGYDATEAEMGLPVDVKLKRCYIVR